MRALKKIIILGAGGHARVIAQCIIARSLIDTSIHFSGYIDPNAHEGTQVGTHKILGCEADVPRLISNNKATHFIVGIGTIRGGNSHRRKIYDTALNAGLIPINVIHPSSIIAPDVKLGTGIIIMPGVVINTGVCIGDNVIINSRTTIDHDCTIGNDVHIAPGCVLSGNIKVGSQSHIGVGSCLIQGLTIGKNVTIGAGTVIIKDVNSEVTIVGVPQRIISK